LATERASQKPRSIALRVLVSRPGVQPSRVAPRRFAGVEPGKRFQTTTKRGGSLVYIGVGTIVAIVLIVLLLAFIF